eukprot:scaffold119873_cov18-Tisochrysis_lutea.AAC.1
MLFPCKAITQEHSYYLWTFFIWTYAATYKGDISQLSVRPSFVLQHATGLLLRPALLKACKGANIYLDCNQEQKVRDVTPHPLSIIIQHHHHLHRTSALSHFLLDKQDCTASLIHCIPYPSSYIIVAITTPHP